MSFRTRVRYRFGDIDDAGIAYYPKLLHYFHCAFEDWWSDGLGRNYAKLMHEDKLGFPAVKIDAEFFAPISYGDEPTVHLGVLRIGWARARSLSCPQSGARSSLRSKSTKATFPAADERDGGVQPPT